MVGFFEAVFKFFFSEFSMRKLLGAIIVIVMALAGLSLYERYTSSFRLGRLQKGADLLMQDVPFTISLCWWTEAYNDSAKLTWFKKKGNGNLEANKARFEVGVTKHGPATEP